MSSIPGSRKIPWKRKRQPTPVFLPGESHGKKSLAGYSPWTCKESDTTEHTLTLTYISTNQGWERVFSNSAEDVASKSKEREFSGNSVALNNGSATFREMVHFTEVDLLDLNYSADLHYLETYLFSIVLDSMSTVESHLLFQ